MTGTPAAPPADDVLDGLLWIATRLTKVRPQGVMTESTRLAAAQRFAVDRWGWDGEAGEVIDAIMSRLPALDEEITRRKYAAALLADLAVARQEASST